MSNTNQQALATPPAEPAQSLFGAGNDGAEVSSAQQTTDARRPPVRMLRFFAVATLLLVVLHTYIGLRLLPDLPGGGRLTPIGIVLLGGSALLIPSGMLARFVITRQTWADRLSWLGALAMGLFSSLLVLTALRDLVLLFALVVAPWLPGGSAISVLPLVGPSAILAPALAGLATLIGFVNARRTPRIVDVDVPVAGLAVALKDFTIVQLSDIHVGPTIKRDYVQAVVDRVNSLDADLIAITGDVVDGTVEQLATHVAPLGRLTARHGTFFVTGNHEYYSGADAWMREFERLGMRILHNTHQTIVHDGALLTVAGVTDYTAHLFDAAARSDPAAAANGSPAGVPRILLAHQPRSATAAADAGFDLQLSGHTHGGQFWPWNHFVPLQQPYTAGLHRLRRLWVYTSRGTGYWGPPKRFGAPSEITRIRLLPEHGVLGHTT